jgi:hypothetical protein
MSLRKNVAVAVTAVLSLVTVSAVAVGGSSAAAAVSSSGGPSQSVIVVLRDQLPTTPATSAHVAARRTAAWSDQNALVQRVDGRTARKASKVVHYTSVNAVSLTADAAEIAQFSADPAVAAVIPNTQVAFVRPAQERTAVTNGAAQVAAPTSDAVCPSDPSAPLLEPEALEDTHAASDNPSDATAQQLTDGSGVKVAYLADAIDPDNPDFIRADGSHVIVDYKAFSADGPTPDEGGAEAYGDASSIAAQGLVSHDLSTFVNPAYPLPAGCNIRILGMAPGASIVALKIDFFTTSIVQAIDYAVSTDHVDVINESFGGAPIPDSSARQAISMFNDAAVAAGTTVTVSTGDAGTTSTIGSPATDPKVISVAADTNSRSYLQTGYAGARFFGNGQRVNDEISSLSSGGFTQRGGTVDITAPGEAGWAACDSGSPECTNFRGGTSSFQLFGGTSQSAPLTAGAAALVISAYRSAHGGHSPSPALVKQLLTSTATDLGLPTFEQGAGLLDARAAVEAALTYPGGTGPVPAGVSSNILLSTDRLEISGAPGSSHKVSVGVRNVGTKPLTVGVAGRDYLTTSVQDISTSIDATSTPTFPYPTNGVPWVYKKVTFTVPSGTDRTALQMIWAGAPTSVGGVQPVVRVSLFDPSGTYVANSRPQGGPVVANYANLDVRKPVAGTWTAVLYTPGNSTGFTGNVTLHFTHQEAVPVGQVSTPTLHLAAGQSGTIKATFKTPANGDTSYALTVASSDGHQTAVPVVMRTVVPTPGGHGTFSGVITGGNARGGSAAQVLTYAFNVPAGRRDVSVGVTLANDPHYLLEGVLVDPRDETQAIDSNLYSSGISTTSGQGLTMQMTAANPMPGTWRVIILVVNPVPGTAITQSFSGRVDYNATDISATGLPTSANTKLPAGHPVTAQIRVHNTGITPINVQVDPRTQKVRTLQLTSPFGPQSFQLPAHAAPTFLVPPGTQALTAVASSAVPAIVDLLDGTQGIDVVGNLPAAQNGSTVSTATVNEGTNDTVGTGVWFTDVNEVGFVGPDGAPTADSSVQLSAKTPDFDSSVTSSTGDFWAVAVDPNADLGSPVTIQPGDTATITVTITPSGHKGTKVNGQLYVYTPPSFAYPTFNTTGDTLKTIPYAYTVG